MARLEKGSSKGFWGVNNLVIVGGVNNNGNGIFIKHLCLDW